MAACYRYLGEDRLSCEALDSAETVEDRDVRGDAGAKEVPVAEQIVGGVVGLAVDAVNPRSYITR